MLSTYSFAPAGFPFSMTSLSGTTISMDVLAGDGRASAARKELATLLERVAAGDRVAFSGVYDRTASKLYGICLRLLGNPAEAQEVLQEAYVTVWRNALRYDSAKASPITWLAVIARNKAIDRLRRRARATEDINAAADVPDDNPSAFDLVARADDEQRLRHCLDELDERSRTMIRAAFLDGATYPELADRQGVPLPTMKSWIRRGLQRLRGCLEQ